MRKLVTIRIDPQIWQTAREMGLNVSKTCEISLKQQIQRLTNADCQNHPFLSAGSFGKESALVGLPGFEPGSREPKSPTIGTVDWQAFIHWFSRDHERSYAMKVLNYARSYAFVLAEPEKARLLADMSKGKRRNVMAALANLAKFLGRYPYWKKIVKDADLTWEKRGAVESFLGIVNVNLEEALSWLTEVIALLEQKYIATLMLQVTTGLRPSEACMAASMIAELNENDGLDRYFNQELSMLQHFKFPDVFIRQNKNCYISFVPQSVLQLVLKTVKGKIKYTAIVSALRKKGLGSKMMQLRKVYATTLREKGITKEIIDLLQGRIGQSIFLRHYYKPYLTKVKAKVLKTLEPMAKDLMQSISQG